MAAIALVGITGMTGMTGDGDGGLDGIVRQDALGIDLVGVQAKRYDKAAAVQRPEVQAFAGALDMAQTSRGVFVTTGRFSSGAKEYARGISKRMILIDGQELARLMVRYNDCEDSSCRSSDSPSGGHSRSHLGHHFLRG